MSTAYLFYGKSGCGKGTQASLLKDRLEAEGKKVIYIETGKLFRQFTETNTGFMSDHVRSVVNAGKLMPAFFPVYLWSRELVEKYTGTEDIILDGVSRRLDEAPIIDSALDFLEIEHRYLLQIHVSDEWVISHMGSRGRADDTPEGMKQRLGWFVENVMPVISYFEQNPKYKTSVINGEQSIEQVAIEIQQSIK